jgi:hypothetical protein
LIGIGLSHDLPLPEHVTAVASVRIVPTRLAEGNRDVRPGGFRTPEESIIRSSGPSDPEKPNDRHQPLFFPTTPPEFAWVFKSLLSIVHFLAAAGGSVDTFINLSSWLESVDDFHGYPWLCVLAVISAVSFLCLAVKRSPELTSDKEPYLSF